jgi:predicted nuclease of predicted toxin-antitoxin system
MLRLVSDENFNGKIVGGLLRRQPDLDLVRAQDVGLSNAKDPEILEWAAQDQRILLTHDRKTMPVFASERVRLGQAMPGVFHVSNHLPVGRAIDEILLLALASLDEEWEGQVLYLPL